MKVFILDAGNQNTLAIVRSLGRHGHEIILGGYQKASLAFFSKYVSQKVMLINPKNDEQAFINGVLKTVREQNIGLLMPVGFKSYQVCTKHQDEIRKYTQLIVTSEANIELAIDKRSTYALAESIGVPCPKTFLIKDMAELESLPVTYPAVIKSAFESGKNEVTYANDRTELIVKFSSMVARNNFIPRDYPVVQEYITGDGYGFFAYYKDGKCRSTFMHHRIREYPVTGGASVCAESFEDEKLEVYGMKILDHLKWNGVAMVEFKKSNAHNEYMLMEINPKFWGSLELAITAGVNFPEMLVDEAMQNGAIYSDRFKKVTFQWVLNGELFHVLERPSAFFKVIKTLGYSAKDISWTDLKPNLYQLLNIFIHYYKKSKADALGRFSYTYLSLLR